MKFTTAWIQEWLGRTITDEQIIAGLERAGLEIEDYSYSKPFNKKLVIGLVKKVVQHPVADRLKIVEVEIGKRSVQVVCGAPNVRTGITVALAQIGTTLPGGERIGEARLRGEISQGMLCSERELGLGKDHSGILEFSGTLKPGTRLCDIYPAQTVVDVKTHANRFDLLSVVGLAREVAAMANLPLKPLPALVRPKGAEPAWLGKKLEAVRFMLASITVQPAAQSPAWLVTRLEAAGVRVLGGVVDITNYVNLELGQPLHAYDADKVQAPVTVRWAKDGEKLVTLDGVERRLSKLDLVVADASGPIGLAGLMGGASTQVDDKTTNILLEAAVFEAVAVRKMAKRHGLRTEASARFERGLPLELPPVALARATTLLQELAGGQVGRLADWLPVPPVARSVSVRQELLERLLGVAVSSAQVVKALARLQIVARSAEDSITVPALPWWRTDVHEGQDLVEEVARVIGYDQIPAVIPPWRPRQVRFDTQRASLRRLRGVLYGAGLFDVMTYSFVSEQQVLSVGLELQDHLKLKNPLSLEQAYLRSTLLASHLQVLERNRTYAKEFSYYELSKVFVKQGSGEQPKEPLRLGVMVRREVAYGHCKGILEAVARELGVKLEVKPGTDEEAMSFAYAKGRWATVRLNGQSIGVIGQLAEAVLRRHKIGNEVAYLELDAGVLVAAARPVQFVPLERFPSVRRDLAVIVAAEVSWQEVAEALADLPGVTVSFVSDYYGSELPAGHKSLALHMAVTHPDRTPTDAEAAALEQKALAILKRKFAALPRS
jgi:phenylalanyl-tRNA synthetase beta chain